MGIGCLYSYRNLHRRPPQEQANGSDYRKTPYPSVVWIAVGEPPGEQDLLPGSLTQGDRLQISEDLPRMEVPESQNAEEKAESGKEDVQGRVFREPT